MFSFYKVILDLLKARTHKYVRRVPIGATHTGSTKYKYYYQEQAGHGHGLGHEEELKEGASFAFGEGDDRYHAHIKAVNGDKLTIEYDDGDKKGQKETLSKLEFQNRIHKEHATSIARSHERAKKQLATFERMKEKGHKVKDSTLNKLKAQVEKFKENTPLTEFEMDALDNWQTLLKKAPMTLEKFKKQTKKMNFDSLISVNIKENLDDALDYLLNEDAQFKNTFSSIYTVFPNLKEMLKKKIKQGLGSDFNIVPKPSFPGYKETREAIDKKVLSSLNDKKEVKDMDIYKDGIFAYTKYLLEGFKQEPKLQDYEAFETWNDAKKRDRDTFLENSSYFINAAYRKDPERVAEAYLREGSLRDEIKNIPNIKQVLISHIKKMDHAPTYIMAQDKQEERLSFYDAYKNKDSLDLNTLPMLLSSDILDLQLNSEIREYVIPFYKSFRFTSWHKTLLKSMKR